MRKNMIAKKGASVLLAATMVMSLAACSGNDASKDTQTATDTAASENSEQSAASEAKSTESADKAAPEDGKVYNIGVCQLLEHPALDAATEGFMTALKDKFGEQNVTFDVQNAQGEQANAATIANNFVANNVDLILANATTSLQCAAAATGSIPILGTSITDYATALEIDDWSGTTGRNISGTSDLAPIDLQEDMLVDMFPDAKLVGILYCSAEPNSKYQATKFEEALDADGISYAEFTAADSNDIASVVQSAVEQVDVLYIPTDNTMAGNTETINNITLPAGIPVIAGEEGICAGCGVATLSISYFDIGYKAGEMGYEILANGADISTMEIEYAPEVVNKYNAEICDKLGITPPEGYEPIE